MTQSINISSNHSDMVQNPQDWVSNHHQILTTTTLLVAKAFNQRHDSVLRKLRAMDCSEEFKQANFTSVGYKDEKGELRPMWEMTKDGFMFLVMGFTGKKAAHIKESYILAFNIMAKSAAPAQAAQPPPKAVQPDQTPDPRPFEFPKQNQFETVANLSFTEVGYAQDIGLMVRSYWNKPFPESKDLREDMALGQARFKEIIELAKNNSHWAYRTLIGILTYDKAWKTDQGIEAGFAQELAFTLVKMIQKEQTQAKALSQPQQPDPVIDVRGLFNAHRL